MPLSINTTITILLNKVTNSTNIDFEDSNVKQVCDLCIESKYAKIVRYKKNNLNNLEAPKDLGWFIRATWPGFAVRKN